MSLVGEGALRALNEGDVVQFERRCYAKLDKKIITEHENLKLEFILIPDGKTKSMSGLKTNVDAKKIAKGK